MPDQQLKEFIRDHFNEDTGRLLMSASRYPGIDVRLAAIIIEVRKKLLTKVPEWAGNENLLYIGSLPTEQCSSYETALYKQQFCQNGRVADITGGMGVDSYYLSLVNKQLVYFERNIELFKATKHNFNELKAHNIKTINAELSPDNACELLNGKYDLIYIDPSRRKSGDRKVHLICDYEPKISELKDHLFLFTDKILIKVSPMVDLKSICKDLKEVKRVDIVAVSNECKELLILLERSGNLSWDNIEIRAVNIKGKNTREEFIFTPDKESKSSCPTGNPESGNFLYEPNSAILKSGAFRLLTSSFDLKKLEVNTHLYTSDRFLPEFPGRKFIIKEVADFDKITIRNLCNSSPKANITVRNFPLSSADLRNRLKIEDGGEITIFGCTISKGAKKLITCIAAS